MRLPITHKKDTVPETETLRTSSKMIHTDLDKRTQLIHDCFRCAAFGPDHEGYPAGRDRYFEIRKIRNKAKIMNHTAQSISFGAAAVGERFPPDKSQGQWSEYQPGKGSYDVPNIFLGSERSSAMRHPR